MPIYIIYLIVSFVITVIAGSILLPLLKKLKVGQTVRDDGPQTHLSKSGTPNMGGLIFLVGIAITLLIGSIKYTSCLYLLIFMFLFEAIGFIDDYIKVVLKRPMGFRAWQKMLGLLLISGAFVFYITFVLKNGTETYIPILKQFIDLGNWLYIPFALLVLLATTNSVNLTDGLDGLATGIMIIIMAFFTVVGISIDNIDVILFCAAITGSCLGFLVFNVNPAQVFMGDTGALALGGALGMVSLITQMPIILIVVAGICVMESVSDILQVFWFKKFKKRIFKMAPLHHHFELCGWSERKVVWVFWIITIVLAVISLLII